MLARANANSYVMEVLFDTDEVRTGSAANGAAWQYFPLGNGDFCTNPFYAACPHRMACARCEFHLPAESQVATALVAKKGLQRMLLEMPLDGVVRRYRRTCGRVGEGRVCIWCCEPAT